jgi:hypothetical protein
MKKFTANYFKTYFRASVKFIGVKQRSGATKMVNIIHRKPGITNGFK